MLKKDLRGYKAILLTRFFGIEEELAEIADFCRNHGIFVIEDLAHAGLCQSIVGDIAVTSLRKFYNVNQGSDIFFSEYEQLELLMEYSRKNLDNKYEYALKCFLSKVHASLARDTTTDQPGHLDALEVTRKLILNTTCAQFDENAVEIAKGRYYNFLQLDKHITAELPTFKLNATWPRNFAPYVYPLLVQNEEQFQVFRRAGIPALRWEEIAPSDCEISKAYRRKLVQLPVHQDIGEKGMTALHCALNKIATLSRK
jgi:hypothetical protein